METYVIPLTTIYESYPYPALLAGHSGTLHSMESDADVFNEVDGSAQLSKGSVFSGASYDDCTAPTWDD